MKYQNPIIPGFYPDPSICVKDGVYYLINSSFEYFPGVPIFKSIDLVNWEQIGNCLTRKSQLELEGCKCSGGIFAPTIRYNNGLFYMITTCVNQGDLKNFYVTTENPESEWSDPIYVDIEGIDPSLFWENDKAYVQYAGFGKVNQVEIDINTGKIIDGPRTITYGCGGRDVEGPHIYKRNGYYYLLLAEGGTREGHMVTLMKSSDIWGPFEKSPYNPVVSNKDKSKEILQCIGHADLVEDNNGKSYLVTLGTRPAKHRTVLGRETMLTPAYWTEDGWLCVEDGIMKMKNYIDGEGIQNREKTIKINMNDQKIPYEIITPRYREADNFEFIDKEELIIKGNSITLNDTDDCMLLAVRQSEYEFNIKSNIKFTPDDISNEAGIVMLMDNNHYMALFITIRSDKKCIVLRKKVADIEKEVLHEITTENEFVELCISGDKEKYYFEYKELDKERKKIGETYIKHLASETCDSPFTGVVGGIYVVGDKEAIVNKFIYKA